MNEMMQLAKERHDQILNSITQKEADIVKLREEAEKLDLFVSLAKELFDRKEDKAPEHVQPATPPQAAETPRIMPVRQDRTA